MKCVGICSSLSLVVIPAKAGIQNFIVKYVRRTLDPVSEHGMTMRVGFVFCVCEPVKMADKMSILLHS